MGAGFASQTQNIQKGSQLQIIFPNFIVKSFVFFQPMIQLG